MADDAAFSLTLGLQSAADKGDAEAVKQTLGALADNDLVSLQSILELRAEANLVLGILVEAADLPSKDLMPPVKDRFVAAAGHLDKAAAALKDAQITKLAADLASFGRRDGNIFELKDKEFAGAVVGAKVVGENRALADELEKEVSALRTRSEAAANAAAQPPRANRPRPDHPDWSRAREPGDRRRARLVLCRPQRVAAPLPAATQHDQHRGRRPRRRDRDQRHRRDRRHGLGAERAA